jgi:hypothetical protein
LYHKDAIGDEYSERNETGTHSNQNKVAQSTHAARPSSVEDNFGPVPSSGLSF